MRWDGSQAGGFTSGEPWLPMGEDIAERNVARFQVDEHSLLWLCHHLISLRRAERALVDGDYVPLRSRNDILSFKRAWSGKEILVALNTTSEPRRLGYEDGGTLLLSTHLDTGGKALPTVLRANEGIVVKVTRE